MRRFLKFLRLVFGDFLYSVGGGIVAAVAIIAAILGVCWLTGNAVSYWFGLSTEHAGGDITITLGLMFLMGAGVSVGFTFGAWFVLCEVWAWLRKKWAEAAQP